MGSRHFLDTTAFATLDDIDTSSIGVPTSLRKIKGLDISYILSVSKEIYHYLQPGSLIISESATYPGMTEEVFFPLRENMGLSRDGMLPGALLEQINLENRRCQLTKSLNDWQSVSRMCTSG